jgi:transposase
MGTAARWRSWSPADSATTARCCPRCWPTSGCLDLGPGAPRTRPDVVVADRAYTNGVNRRMLAARGVKTVIPQKNTEVAARLRRGSAGGRPPAFDAEIYKGRNVVERSFNLSKQWRGLATRYDKLAITYRAAAVLQACIRWLRLLGDTA